MKTIIRARLSADFVQLPNSLVRDSRLSFRARGVLSMILSHSDEWIVTRKWLETQGLEGREAITGALTELEALGYAVFTRTRREGGHYAPSVWTFFAVPRQTNERTQALQPADHTTAIREAVLPQTSENNVSSEDNREDNPPIVPHNPPGPQNTELGEWEIIAGVELPSGIREPQLLEASRTWISYQRELGKPMSLLRLDAFVQSLLSYGSARSAGEAIRRAIASGWRSMPSPAANVVPGGSGAQHGGSLKPMPMPKSDREVVADFEAAVQRCWQAQVPAQVVAGITKRVNALPV